MQGALDATSLSLPGRPHIEQYRRTRPYHQIGHHRRRILSYSSRQKPPSHIDKRDQYQKNIENNLRCCHRSSSSRMRRHNTRLPGSSRESPLTNCCFPWKRSVRKGAACDSSIHRMDTRHRPRPRAPCGRHRTFFRTRCICSHRSASGHSLMRNSMVVNPPEVWSPALSRRHSVQCETNE